MYIKTLRVAYILALAMLRVTHAGCGEWPVLKSYDQEFANKIALSTGGAGTASWKGLNRIHPGESMVFEIGT